MVHDARLMNLVQDIKTTAGTVVKTVGYYEDNEWFRLYSRSDFKTDYSRADQQKIANEAMLEGLAKRTREHVWKAGELEYFVFQYTDIIVVQVGFDETSGVLLGLDSVPLRDLARIIDRCLSFRDATKRNRSEEAQIGQR